MRIGIYSPYLDTFGGGEKYILTIGEYLSKEHEVEFLLGTHLYDLNIDNVKTKFKSLHDLDLSKINFIKAPFGKGSFFLERLLLLPRYDYFFYLTDGSLFYSTAKNNIIHFQVPFKNIATKGLWGKIKLSAWKLAVFNSNFTKQIVGESWPNESVVVYPPVTTDLFKPLKKKKQIISVGRFAGHTKSKKQEVLIEVFKELSLKNWSLHLVGGATEGDKEYIEVLKKMAKRLPINFYENLELSKLTKLYGESSIYWHAAGFGEDNPEKFEHFGISTVEAMSAGCVPVVIKKGGQVEIVEDGKNGFLWDDLREFKHRTIEIIKDSKLQQRMSVQAVNRAKLFSSEHFKKEIGKLVV